MLVLKLNHVSKRGYWDDAYFLWIWVYCSSLLILTHSIINGPDTVANWMLFEAYINPHIWNRWSGLLTNTYNEGRARCYALDERSICVRIWRDFCQVNIGYFGIQMPHESEVGIWQIQKNIAQLGSINSTRHEIAGDRDLSLFSVIKQHLAHRDPKLTRTDSCQTPESKV